MGQRDRAKLLAGAKKAARQKSREAHERQLKRKPWLAVQEHWVSEFQRVFDPTGEPPWGHAEKKIVRAIGREYKNNIGILIKMVSLFIEWWSMNKEGPPSLRYFWAARGAVEQWAKTGSPADFKKRLIQGAEWDPAAEDEEPTYGW